MYTYMYIYGCFYNGGVLGAGVLVVRALLFGDYITAPGSSEIRNVHVHIHIRVHMP